MRFSEIKRRFKIYIFFAAAKIMTAITAAMQAAEIAVIRLHMKAQAALRA